MNERQTVSCHKLIRSTAKEMCGAMYESYASLNDEFYKKYPYQREYIREGWPLFIEEARTTLVKMLSTNISERLKSEIHEAIVQDQRFRFGRQAAIGRIYSNDNSAGR